MVPDCKQSIFFAANLWQKKLLHKAQIAEKIFTVLVTG
tara:strand:- start:329 stop:442 length:114 start_codon:yes stop_codon:yes gene_type:complete